MSQAYNPHSIDLELQVRLMNLVMGEASDFERDQLQLLMEQRPELATYFQHLEHLHGLLCIVGAGESSMSSESSNSAEAWQLSPDRRQQVLAVLDGKEVDANPKVMLASAAKKKWLSIRTRWLAIGVTAAAACLVVSLRLQSSSSQRFAARFSGGTASSFKTIPEQAGNVAAASIPLSIMEDSIRGFSRDSDTEANLPQTVLAPNQVANGSMYRGITLGKDLTVPSGPGEGRDWGVMAPSGHPGSFGEMSSGKGGAGGMGGGMPGGMGGGMGGSPVKPGSGGPGGGGRRGGDFGGYGGGGYGGGEGGFGGGFGGGSDGMQLAYGQFGAAGTTANAPTSQLGTVVDGRDERFGNDFDNRPTSDSKSIANTDTFGRFDSGAGLAYNLDSAADFIKSEKTIRDRMDSDVDLPQTESFATHDKRTRSDVTATLSMPDGGTVSLGGIELTREPQPQNQLNRLYKSNVPPSSSESLMMTVTPRVIIPEKEEEAIAKLPEVRLREAERGATQDAPLSLPSLLPSDPDSSRQLNRFRKDAKDLNGIGGKLQDLSSTDALDDEIGSVYFNKAKIQRRGEVKEGEVTEKSASLGIADGSKMPTDAYGLNGSTGKTWEYKKQAPQQPLSLDEQTATAEAFSTFSLHVSDVSFKLAQAALNQGQWPEAAKIRIEEFVNAMDYHDPLPSGNQKVACRIDQAIHPFLMQRNLLRVSMRTAATGRSQNTPLRLTILLDNSGSMERPDRRQSVLRAFQSLTQQLSANDQVTLISFASTPRLLADKVPGNEGAKLMQLIETLPSEGGTNIEAALMLAREKATEQQLAGAQNRIVMLTDGAVNLGDANPDSLAKLVTQMRDAGIAFDAAGISALNLNDEVLETLTRQGDGRYYLIDSAQSAGETFANQIAGALRPSAQNVKVQVEFNPQRVGRYKLLGFEKHRLNKEDFRNDKVDAAEMAAAEAGVAVYQYEIKPNGSGDVGSVSVRFRDLSTGQMVERRWPILFESNTPRLEQSQASIQLAACAAFFAAKLVGGPLTDSVDMTLLQKTLAKLPEPFASQTRVQELRAMIEQALAIR